MERKRNLFENTVHYVSRLWDREDRPTKIEAKPATDMEDRVLFVVNGNEHERIITEEQEDRHSSNS